MVEWFGRRLLSRRELIARLSALGAAAAGLPLTARAAKPVGALSTFQAVDLNHIALSVSDVERSHAWYQKHLGLEPMGEVGFLATGRGWLALFRGGKPGLHHYCYSIRNYNPGDAVAKLRAAGLTPKVRGRRVYFDDPDGIECQIANEIEGSRLTGVAAAATFQAADFNHIALNVSDVQRSRLWYEKHLGLKVMQTDGERSCFLTTGKGWVALFKSETPGLRHYCYSLDDYELADAVAKLKAAGLTPKVRGGRVYFDDPDGIECLLAKTDEKNFPL